LGESNNEFIAGLSNEAPTEEMRVRDLTPKWDDGEGLVNHTIPTCCSSVTDHDWKGQNTGGALAVTNGLHVGQVEGRWENFPSTLYCKNALIRTGHPLL